LRRVHVVLDDGTRAHIRVCTRCISAGKIRKAGPAVTGTA
jgi:ribosomal protein L28